MTYRRQSDQPHWPLGPLRHRAREAIDARLMGNHTELTASQVCDGFDDFSLCIHHEWSVHDDRLVDRFAAEQQQGRDAYAPPLPCGGTRTHLTFSARAHFLKSGGKL